LSLEKTLGTGLARQAIPTSETAAERTSELFVVRLPVTGRAGMPFLEFQKLDAGLEGNTRLERDSDVLAFAFSDVVIIGFLGAVLPDLPVKTFWN
jgi:hypothetical protein